MASSIEIGESPTKIPRNRPKTPQASYTPRFQDSLPTASQMKQHELSTLYPNNQNPKKAELFDLELSSIPESYTAPQIKELCGGIHVVSLTVDIDNFTGTCRGLGRLKVRTNESKDIERLEKVFRYKGIRIQQHSENVGRKTNYAEISNVS